MLTPSAAHFLSKFPKTISRRSLGLLGTHEDWKQQRVSRRPLRKSQRHLQSRRSKPKRADLIRRYRAKSIEIRCQLPCICTNGKRFGAEPTISVRYREIGRASCRERVKI